MLEAVVDCALLELEQIFPFKWVAFRTKIFFDIKKIERDSEFGDIIFFLGLVSQLF